MNGLKSEIKSEKSENLKLGKEWKITGLKIKKLGSRKSI